MGPSESYKTRAKIITKTFCFAAPRACEPVVSPLPSKHRFLTHAPFFCLRHRSRKMSSTARLLSLIALVGGAAAAALTDEPRNLQARGIALTGARALQGSEPKDLAAADDANNGLVSARRKLEYGAPGTIAGLATGAMIILVYVILPLIILFSPLILVGLIIVVYCHCRHRKKRINYNALSMITAEERKERAKQYMAQFNPSQARPVVEAAPVAKMV